MVGFGKDWAGTPSTKDILNRVPSAIYRMSPSADIRNDLYLSLRSSPSLY